MTYIQGFMIRDIYDQLFFGGWISADELHKLRYILIRHYAQVKTIIQLLMANDEDKSQSSAIELEAWHLHIAGHIPWQSYHRLIIEAYKWRY